VPPRGPTIRERIGGLVAAQPLGLVALILVVAGGSSAYAADRLAKNSVTSKTIKNATVKAPDLGKGAVTTKKLAKGSVTVTKLGDGAVTVTKIGDGQVTSAKIADAAITGAKLADGSVSGAKIADGAVTGADIADGAIGASELDPATVGDVMSAAGNLTSGATAKDILAIEGFGVLRASCTFPDTMGFSYALDSPVTQRARLFGRDAIDNVPISTLPITGTTGASVNYSAAGHQMLAGELWTSTADRVLWVEIWIDFACAYRARATVDRNQAP
jgi:hypothetical protein